MPASYASCWWLQDHIEFSYDGTIHACCYGYPKRRPDSSGRGWDEVGHIYLCDVKDNKFPHEEIRKNKHLLHAMIARNDAEAEVCLECPVLKTQAWPETNYLVSKISLNTWLHCNLKCQYCFVAQPNFKPRRIAYDLHAVIEDMLTGGHLDPNGQVTWGGGDISALPEFNRVSKLFIGYGVFQNFKTSGFKFLRGVAGALQQNLGLVEVSVDAGTAETYARVKGKDAFDRVVSNLVEYSRYGKIQLKYIVMKDNLEDKDIDGFLNLARMINVGSAMVTPEWGQCHDGAFDDGQLGRIARLIDSLKAFVPEVSPSTGDDGERLFPGIWRRLEGHLAAVQAA